MHLQTETAARASSPSAATQQDDLQAIAQAEIANWVIKIRDRRFVGVDTVLCQMGAWSARRSDAPIFAKSRQYPTLEAALLSEGGEEWRNVVSFSRDGVRICWADGWRASDADAGLSDSEHFAGMSVAVRTYPTLARAFAAE